jgi:uncharacterized SAM-binding protein YcdF (DUF218 family)
MGSAKATAKKSKSRGLDVFLWILTFTLLLGASASLVVLLDLGNWLVREDPMRPAAAIAVLSGNVPVRAIEAAELYRAGYAKEIWLTHPGEHADPLKELGISYPSEDDFNIRVLRREGVPARAIRVLDMSIVNTADELEAISAALQTSAGRRVIIVTNKAHTRRVHLLWRKYFGSRGEAIVHGASGDDFVADQWWRYSGSMNQVFHEVLGILNAWAGMPVQPGPRRPSITLAQEPSGTPDNAVD